MSELSAGKAVPASGGASEGPGGPESSWGESDREDVGLSWPQYCDYQSFGVEYGGALSEGRFHWPHSEEALLDEGAEEYTPFYYYPQEDREESEVEKFLYRVPSTDRRSTIGRQPLLHDPRRKSLFVHSSPSHFPDISQARKSAFGSIFLRTTGNAAEDAALLRTVTDSSYSMLHSLLNSIDKIISSSSSESDRKNIAIAYKQSLLKALESHGISRAYSDGSIQWNIYPIAHDYLFAVQIGDNMHETRQLSRIEERIISGSLQRPRIPYAWPTDSVWTGHWDALGMAGIGTYLMPHGVSYNGKLQNGVFHDDNATLTYPSKFKALHCVFVKGKLESCQFQFPDMLMHEEENWGYCKAPDRRFWSEVQNGLKPAKIAQKTEIDPPVKIPRGTYDTSDGFYDPKSLMLISPTGELLRHANICHAGVTIPGTVAVLMMFAPNREDIGQMFASLSGPPPRRDNNPPELSPLRVPVCEEDLWIRKYCRKGFPEPTDFRPDLFENWFNHDQDLIQEILNGQAKYRAGKITYEELQQLYADLNLMPSWSKYKRRKSPSEIAFEEYLSSIPEPSPLHSPGNAKKYQGHALPSSVRMECADFSMGGLPSSKVAMLVPSKSLLRFNTGSGQKFASAHGLAKASRISFRINGDLPKALSGTSGEAHSASGRKIPEKFLKYQPILKPPFSSRTEIQSPSSGSEGKKKKCVRKSSSVSSPSWDIVREEYFGEGYGTLERKELKKFIKSIIMERVTDILMQERERLRKRLKWARKVPQKPSKAAPRGGVANCVRVLGELFDSIPDREEFCDSHPKKTCDLKKLAEDKYQMLHYWGKKIYLLDFKDGVS